MKQSTAHGHALPTPAEEIASAVTHGIGAALSVAGLIVLVVWSVLYGDAWHLTSAAIYGSALVFLYLASTLYHSIQVNPAKRFFLVLDHVGISLLIAGTYTPILLIKMRNPQGWTFFAIIWTLAVTVSCIKAFFAGRYTKVSTAIYVIMGWLSLLMINAVVDAIGLRGLAWLAAGGLAYSLGIIPFLWDRLPYNHAIWHLFVIAGSVCHFLAITWYVLPGAHL